VRNCFTLLHRISWDPYNGAEDLIPKAKKYKQELGCYPERICADRIYISTKNRNFCTRNNIRLSGKRLGKPPKDPEINAAHKQQLSADQRRRNEVEGCFGSGKLKYSLELIRARLDKGAETPIFMAFLVMCAEKILRLRRLFFVAIFLGFTPCNGQACSGWRSGPSACLRQLNRWSVHNLVFELSTPLVFGCTGAGLRFVFQESLSIMGEPPPWK
jgi:hypothetical protein